MGPRDGLHLGKADGLTVGLVVVLRDGAVDRLAVGPREGLLLLGTTDGLALGLVVGTRVDGLIVVLIVGPADGLLLGAMSVALGCSVGVVLLGVGGMSEH